MRVNTLVGIALGVVTGAILASSSTQVSDAVTKGRNGFDKKWKKFQSVMK